MKKSIFITIIIVIIVIAAGALVLSNKKTDELAVPSVEQNPSLGVPAPGFKNTPAEIVSDGQQISMQAGNFFFSPNSLTVAKGQQVKFNIQNTGFHTFTIDELGVNISLSGSGNYTAEFTPTQSGTFEYYCAVPGHREGGMFGNLKVI